MYTTPIRSTKYAKSTHILGHTSSGMGEKTLALKMQKAITQAGYHSFPIVDILEFLGEDYESLAQLNYDLASHEHSLLDDLKEKHLEGGDLLLILSWCFSVAALLATGIHKKQPTAIKLFAHHPNERIIKKLYEPANLIITESLLANERALTYGFDPAKVLYLPHTYPAECADFTANRNYVQRLAQEQGKSVGKNTQVIGCVGRLEYGKNYEFAVEAVRRLFIQKKDVLLVLKGDFSTTSPYPDYQPLFTKMLHAYAHEPWLLWDRTSTPFPQVLEEYASFDLLLHPSGAEGGSHVVVECLGLGKPVIVLDCSTNPYLFKDLAIFVQTTGEMRPGQLCFYVPDMDHLCQVLSRELKVPDPAQVEARFHERVLAARIPLLFEPEADTIKKLYAEDRKLYSI